MIRNFTKLTRSKTLLALGLSGTLAAVLASASFSQQSADSVLRSKESADKVLIAKKPAGIRWYKDFAQALKAAKESRKWVLVDVYTDWCHWCKKLDEDVYAKPQIIAFLNKSFICVKANAEKGDGIGIAKKYLVDGYPCTLILEPSGKERGRMPGYIPLAQFPHEVTRILQTPAK